MLKLNYTTIIYISVIKIILNRIIMYMISIKKINKHKRKLLLIEHTVSLT